MAIGLVEEEKEQMDIRRPTVIESASIPNSAFGTNTNIEGFAKVIERQRDGEPDQTARAASTLRGNSGPIVPAKSKVTPINFSKVHQKSKAEGLSGPNPDNTESETSS